MEINRITNQLVSQTLRAWLQGGEAPPNLLELDFLQEASPAPAAVLSIRLQDEISAIARGELGRQRQAEGLDAVEPAALSRENGLSAIAVDFAPGNAELQAWSALYFRYLCGIPFSSEELAAAIPVDPRHFRRRLSLGIDRLTTVLQRRELAAHDQQPAQRRRRHLPAPDYVRLIGVEDARDELAALLREEGGPALLSIEGLGGMGKTALARAIALELARQSNYEEIAWISARHTWLSEQGTIETVGEAQATLDDIIGRLCLQLGLDRLAGQPTADKLAFLASYLAQRPHLIVFDNLENVADLDRLIPSLPPLAGATRFLLTSRQGLSRYPYVFRKPLKPLSAVDSKALFEAELARRGRPLQLSEDELKNLYQIVGGMPLALKLVAAQCGHWPLPAILLEMASAAAGAPEALYAFIYRRTWLVLDDPARSLLLSMLTISPEGEATEWLRLFSALDPAHFESALRQLLDYSLLEQSGSLQEPAYRLHRLTVTFLQSEIAQRWSPPKAGERLPESGEGRS
ncbi:MAG: NB-ARC domain-containing protein [Candidatus Promineifilaceae bacterium]